MTNPGASGGRMGELMCQISSVGEALARRDRVESNSDALAYPRFTTYQVMYRGSSSRMGDEVRRGQERLPASECIIIQTQRDCYVHTLSPGTFSSLEAQHFAHDVALVSACWLDMFAQGTNNVSSTWSQHDAWGTSNHALA